MRAAMDSARRLISFPVPLATHIEHRAVVRMTQRREGLGFRARTAGQLGISHNVLGQDFDGNRSVQACVTGFVDFTHPSI